MLPQMEANIDKYELYGWIIPAHMAKCVKDAKLWHSNVHDNTLCVSKICQLHVQLWLRIINRQGFISLSSICVDLIMGQFVLKSISSQQDLQPNTRHS